MNDEYILNLLDFYSYLKYIESDILDDEEVIYLDLDNSFNALENSLEGRGYHQRIFNQDSDRWKHNNEKALFRDAIAYLLDHLEPQKINMDYEIEAAFSTVDRLYRSGVLN